MKNQFTSRIVKLTFAFMFVLIASSCSQDDDAMDAAVLANEINSEIAAKGGKAVTSSAYTSSVTGHESVVCLDINATREFTLSGWKDGAQVNVQIWDESLLVWVSIDSFIGQLPSSLTLSYTFPATGVYNLRYQVSGSAADGGTNGFNYFDVTAENCNTTCDESFSYDENEDGSYTFTYVPAVDMTDVNVEFTFPQGVTGLNGFTRNGNDNSSVWSATKSFEACKTYTYTVTLTPDCSGNSKNSNVWTDFKVNVASKKGNLDNITMSCN